MINPHIALNLRHAKRIFQKRGQPNLARSAHITLGMLADAILPDEGHALHLIRLAS